MPAVGCESPIASLVTPQYRLSKNGDRPLRDPGSARVELARRGESGPFSSPPILPRNRQRDEISASRQRDRRAADSPVTPRHGLVPCSKATRTPHAAALLPFAPAFPFCPALFAPACRGRCACSTALRQLLFRGPPAHSRVR